MITDPQRIKKDDPGHPDICNVYSYYRFFFPEQVEGLSEECKAGKVGCVADKAKLADCLIELLRPIQERRNKILSDRAGLEAVLKEGARKARAVASETMSEVRKAVGI
jgi:tryptophanyl-tRNA synthetase